MRLDECGLRMMSGELEGGKTTSKIANKPKISERVAVLWSVMGHLWSRKV